MLLPYLNRFHMVHIPQYHIEQPTSLIGFLQLLRHQGLGLNIFSTNGASSGSSCVSYSNMPFSLIRVSSGFFSFPLLTNTPLLLSFKNFSSDIFILYILIVTVHGSSESKLDFSRAR